MKRLLILVLISIIYASCKVQYQPRTFENIFIKEIKMDSISIRSIQVIDANNIVYTGSNGKIGFLSLNKEQIKIDKIITPHIYSGSIIPDFRSLAFNGESYFALSVGNPALLYKVFNDKAKLVYKEINQKVFYDSMHFFDDNIHGIAVGDPTEDCAAIILTSNRGETWSKLPCDNLPKFEEGEAFFAASNTNIKTIGSNVWIASGGKKSRILKSNDFGKTWEIYDTPIIQGNGPQGIYSIDFYDVNNGIAIGGDYSKPLENKQNKAITKDGGKTWQLVANNKAPNYKSCIQYVPNTYGQEIFSLGKTGVSFSNDGGKTWRDISKESYYTIKFVDKNMAWLSGNNKLGKLDLKTLR